MTTNNKLAEALEQCRAQFQFYADEHTKADKTEKAATNQRFADMCAAILHASTDAAAVAWTGSGSLLALEDGREGYIWPTKTDAHPVPLYAHPPVADAAVAGEVEHALSELEGSDFEAIRRHAATLRASLHPAPAEPSHD